MVLFVVKIALARMGDWSMADYSGDSLLMLTLTSASAATLGWSPYSYTKFTYGVPGTRMPA